MMVTSVCTKYCIHADLPLTFLPGDLLIMNDHDHQNNNKNNTNNKNNNNNNLQRVHKVLHPGRPPAHLPARGPHLCHRCRTLPRYEGDHCLLELELISV